MERELGGTIQLMSTWNIQETGTRQRIFKEGKTIPNPQLSFFMFFLLTWERNVKNR